MYLLTKEHFLVLKELDMLGNTIQAISINLIDTCRLKTNMPYEIQKPV